MQAAIADLVDPIFNAGISLRDRLEAGEPLEWDRERASLVQLLLALQSVEPSDAVESAEEIAFDFSTPDDPAEQSRLTQATIRFALMCWLDEFLGWHSAWGANWRQNPLTRELDEAPTSDSKFWDEARYAQTRGDLDTLEVMYWCAMLGYRGSWRDNPEQLKTWVTRAKTLLAQSGETWAMPANLATPARDVRQPADGRHRGMMFSVGLALALATPLALMLVWRFST